MSGYSLPRFILLPGVVVASFVAFFGLEEWYSVGWIADPAVLKQYPFGVGEAINEGGWHYQNASLYARTELAEGLAFLVVFAAFVAAALKPTKRLLAIAYALFFLAWGVMYFITHQAPA